MLRTIIATGLLLSTVVSCPAFAGDPVCVPASSCPGMNDANAAYHYQEQQREQQRQRELNNQNGASQYTGPTLQYNNGTVIPGYRWSTR